MRHLIAMGITVCGLLGTGLLAQDTTDDPIAAELNKARQAYEAAVEKAGKVVVAAFDKRSRDVSADRTLSGERLLEALEAIETEKAKFLQDRTFPDTRSMAPAKIAYDQSLEAAQVRLDTAYDAAIDAYARKRDLVKAREIRALKTNNAVASSVRPKRKNDRASQKEAKAKAAMKAQAAGFDDPVYDGDTETVNRVEVKVGDPQFTLIWDSPGDLDLHVISPDNKELYWEQREGAGGQLDVDDIDGFGPENVFWDKNAAHPAGKYRWFVHYYGSPSGQTPPTRWKVRIKHKGKVMYQEGAIEQKGERSPVNTLDLD